MYAFDVCQLKVYVETWYLVHLGNVIFFNLFDGKEFNWVIISLKYPDCMISSDELIRSKLVLDIVKVVLLAYGLNMNLCYILHWLIFIL